MTRTALIGGRQCGKTLRMAALLNAAGDTTAGGAGDVDLVALASAVMSRPVSSVEVARGQYLARLSFKQQKHRDALRKARDAAEVRHVYDRATMRSVFRSIQRKLAGRWDGKPV